MRNLTQNLTAKLEDSFFDMTWDSFMDSVILKSKVGDDIIIPFEEILHFTAEVINTRRSPIRKLSAIFDGLSVQDAPSESREGV